MNSLYKFKDGTRTRLTGGQRSWGHDGASYGQSFINGKTSALVQQSQGIPIHVAQVSEVIELNYIIILFVMGQIKYTCEKIPETRFP